jgi:hypothetical protein
MATPLCDGGSWIHTQRGSRELATIIGFAHPSPHADETLKFPKAQFGQYSDAAPVRRDHIWIKASARRRISESSSSDLRAVRSKRTEVVVASACNSPSSDPVITCR